MSAWYTELVEKPINLQIDHFFGTGDIAKVITEDSDLSKITVKQLKNVSDILNNKDNCFGIEKDINARKGWIPLKDYPNDPLIKDYLKKETRSGKRVIEHLKNNVIHMQKETGKDGALTRHVGDHLNDLINKLEPAVIDNNNENENEFAIAGNEGVAEVIAVSDQLNNDFKVGDWVVMEKPGFGTWCTHAIANRNEVTRIPNDGIGLIQAATLTVNPCSAYRMLKDFVVDLKENDFVIQNGANSGVGQSIIQIANAWGIKTINIVRNRPDIDELKSHLGSLGATYTATDEELSHFKFKNTIKDLLLEHKTSSGIRLGLNCIGGKATTDMIKHLSESGHVVTYGAMSHQPITIPASLLIFKNIKFHGFWMAKWNELHPKEERVKMLEEIVSLMKDGKFTDMRNEVTVWGDENDNDETLKKKFFAVYDKAGAAFSGKKQIIKLKNTN
nr:8804_t:CDS:2 [Entrophospora candida]